MQYLYCGGTESLHIRNTEVMEVGVSQSTDSKSCLATSLCVDPQFCLCLLRSSSLQPSFSSWRPFRDTVRSSAPRTSPRKPASTSTNTPRCNKLDQITLSFWLCSCTCSRYFGGRLWHLQLATRGPNTMSFVWCSFWVPRSWRPSSRDTFWRTWCCSSNSTASSSCCMRPRPPRAPRPVPASTQTSYRNWRRIWPCASAPSTSPPPRAPWCDVLPRAPPTPACAPPPRHFLLVVMRGVMGPPLIPSWLSPTDYITPD